VSNWKSGDAKRSVERITRTKEMTFTSLHHHSTFSYLDGYGTPEAHVLRAAELGMTSLALTEHGNVSSHVRLEQAADEQGIKPIYGCELYCGGVGEGATHRKNHLTVLAENEDGYKNLLRVVSRGWSEGFYYEPTVSGEMLNDHKDGLIVLSGCTGSLLATSLIGGKNVAPGDASYERALDVAMRMKRTLGDSFYLEVQAFPELDKTKNINVAYAEINQKLGIPLVATLDAHYTTPDESEMQQILHGLRPGKRQTVEDKARDWGYDVPLTMPLTDSELWGRLVGTGLSKKQAEQAIRTAREIAERCNVRIPKVENLRFPLPPDASSSQVLFRRWINEGWKYRRFISLPENERALYIERVKYEMELIESKGFIDYFLVVSEAVKFAKDSAIPVGPARGSAAASLVCYLLRITEVNPMLFPTLLFERFIDANRHDLPDIDLDFDDERRGLVQAHLEHLYGSERVGNIATFVKFKGRNSLDDVARHFKIPKEDVETVKGLLITRSSGDLRANATIEDSVEMFPQVKDVFTRNPDLYKAQRLEGNYKSMSVHAAGLVIANGPLSDFCAIYTRREMVRQEDGTKKEEVLQVVSLDKYDAEYLNVLKLDALGLNTMALCRIALNYIGMSLTDLYEVPLNDESSLRGFQDGDVVGVFQFDGRAMRSVNQGVRPDNFMEVADVNALARPGPLHSGATAEYIDVKHGRKPATHYHEIIDGITRHTNYQVVYQEQILQIVRELGGFSWEEAARIRKIISKKRGEQEFNQQRDKFVEGAAEHGMKAEEANRVFSMLATAGAYAFNAAHCVSYGMLAYWTMWLKRNHPHEFYVAALQKYGDKVSSLLGDLKKFERAIEVKPLRLNHSGFTWTLDSQDKSILPGFTQIPGVGTVTAHAILDRRADLERFDTWAQVQSTKGIGPVTINTIKSFISDEDPFNLQVLGEQIEETRAQLVEGIDDGSGVFYLPQPTHTAAEVPYDRTPTNVSVVWLGVVRSRNLKDLFENYHSRTGEHLDPNKVKDPDLNEWVVMQCEDDTDVIVVTIDRWKYRRFKERIWSITPNEDLVLIKGYKMGKQARRAIYVIDMWILTSEESD
jgi:DNA polymerase III subunit alpha